MALSDLTDSAAVLDAIAEFERLGRGPFLSRYGFRRALSYFLIHEGKRYDSKAIAAVAHGIQHPEMGPLPADEFSGGEKTVKAKLRSLGFKVIFDDADNLLSGLNVAPDDQRTAWAEITSLEHGHGGPGWELGEWLWSPTTARDGADRYGVMLLPQPGDQVFHLVAGVDEGAPKKRVLFGASLVAQSAVIVGQAPSAPGSWGGMGAYYKIALKGIEEFATKVGMDEIEAGLEDVIMADLLARAKYYPYSSYRDGFRGAQGIYLAKLSPALAGAFRELSDLSFRSELTDGAHTASDFANSFAEGERSRREATFFKRNPKLRSAAIDQHGLACFGCDFNFELAYGEVGAGYIEIHHLNPLAERNDSVKGEVEMTRIEEVIPLCANCHRIVHRRKKLLSLDDLRAAIRQGRQVQR